MDSSREDSTATLIAPLAALMKSRSFRKDRMTWRKHGGDTILVLNLQRSQWSHAYYVNLGVFFCALGEAEKPTENQCHIRQRLDTLLPDPSRWPVVLDMDSPVALETRADELAWFVQEFGLPWLAQRATIEAARASFNETETNCLITGQARALLIRAGDV